MTLSADSTEPPMNTTDGAPIGLPKAPTGISGLDTITNGGLPAGRSTLVCGGPGSGKSMLAIEFLVRGAMTFDEPGVLVTFDESKADLYQNSTSLGFDLATLEREQKLVVLEFPVGEQELIDGGDFSLEGLFIQLEHAARRIGARRVVLDTVEALFGSLDRPATIRMELMRLVRWLKAQGLTSVITGERGEGSLTRHGVEAYVSDCVLVLDHRVKGQLSMRRMRVVKYRGSTHSHDENPFLIGSSGISVIPLSSVDLDHTVSTETVGTGVPSLDAILSMGGFYRGSSVLISGDVGTGKSSLAAAFIDASCRRGERCLYFALEEAPEQILRNMRSLGIDLEPWMKDGRLQLIAMRPTMTGLEEHLVTMFSSVQTQAAQAVVIDPISNFLSIGDDDEVRSMLTRLFDHLKTLQITTFATTLLRHNMSTAISSLLDTWIALSVDETDSEHRRLLHVVKARGMAHTRGARELVLSSEGISLLETSTSQRSRPVESSTQRDAS